MTAPSTKLESAAELLRANPRSIVFTRTRHGATNLAADLARLGVTTVDLHGSLSQNARERNLRKFKTGQADVVVATDVAARGIHVDGVSLVVHYDVPTEHKAYLHRSGRTARAGSSGIVVTMTTPRHIGSVVQAAEDCRRDRSPPRRPYGASPDDARGACRLRHRVGSGELGPLRRQPRSPYADSSAPRRSGGGSSHSRRRPESAESPRRPAAKRDDRRHESAHGERRFDDRPRRAVATTSRPEASSRRARDDRQADRSSAPRARERPRSAELTRRTTAPQQQRR